MSRARAAALLALLLASTAQAHDGGASDADLDLAKAHFNTGQIEYDHGKFADAAREFEEAYRLSGRAPLLYNVGKSYDGASDFARALDAYQRFTDAAAPDSQDRAFAEKRVALLRTLVGHIGVEHAVAGSLVSLDGVQVGAAPLTAQLTVNPGRHQIDLVREGYATFRAAVDVPVGGTATLTAQQTELVKVVRVEVPQKERTPVYKKWWLWTAVGAVVVAGVVTAAVLATRSSPSLQGVQLPAVR
jgi:tetratricopeptide (TPR) repeat protein